MFVSKDTAGFSQAVNDAIANAYGSYTLTDVVDPAFELDVNSIQVSAGEVVVGQDENGNTTITWTINGMPFTKHTMTFQEKLKADENGVYPNGSFDTNEGGAILYNGEEQVNLVPTPVLSRGDETPVEPEVPETGDSSSPLVWSAMMVVAGGAVLVLVRKKKAA